MISGEQVTAGSCPPLERVPVGRPAAERGGLGDLEREHVRPAAGAGGGDLDAEIDQAGLDPLQMADLELAGPAPLALAAGKHMR